MFNWHQTVKSNIDLLIDLYPDLRISTVVVNDGSTLEIESDMKELEISLTNFKYYQFEKNQGKGSSIRHAVEQENADYYLFTDIDFPYETTSIKKIIDPLVSGRADVTLGIRNSEYYQNIPSSRRIISKILKKANQLLFDLVTNDTQCGLKGFNRNRGRVTFLKTSINGYLFDLEFVYLISGSKDLTILTVPVQLREGIKLSALSFKSLLIQSLDYLKLLVKRFSFL